jgi:hypothetical protein
MRNMSFAKLWDKLKNPVFTTFRYPRKDRDWSAGERVSVFIKNRSPSRVFCGIAEIVRKDKRTLKAGSGPGLPAAAISPKEAVEDGFQGIISMQNFR